MTIMRMRIACRVPKATDKHSEYVTIFAFPLQLWLHERASLLRYTFIAYLVIKFKRIYIYIYICVCVCVCVCEKKVKCTVLNKQLEEFILVINQLEHKISFYNKFISCPFMFRAHGQNCITQPLVSSH